MVNAHDVRSSSSRARSAAAEVKDPEIPELTIDDLGILRNVSVDASDAVTVEVTPTYSGCPAVEVILADVHDSVVAAGFHHVVVRTVLAPAWTTDWITERGRRKLLELGIAPPLPRSAKGPVPLVLAVMCPRCHSTSTAVVSPFGATACKALWKCRACQEMFEHFKAI